MNGGTRCRKKMEEQEMSVDALVQLAELEKRVEELGAGKENKLAMVVFSGDLDK